MPGGRIPGGARNTNSRKQCRTEESPAESGMRTAGAMRCFGRIAVAAGRAFVPPGRAAGRGRTGAPHFAPPGRNKGCKSPLNDYFCT